MAAAYRVVVSSVSCYNSVVVDRRTHSHAVHYCSGPCRALSQGLDCSVAHHGTCSELLATPDSPYPDLNGLSGHSRCMTTQQIPHHGKTNGTIDTGYNCAALERAGSNGNLFIGEESNMWRGKKFPTGGGSTGNLSCSTYGSLKDITEEAINLASGKLKEFSFDKLRLSSSSHVTFRKGRKVRPDSFSRRSTDLEIIYGHFGSNVSSNGTTSSTAAAPNDENAPPLFETKQKGSSSSSSVVTKVNGSSGSGSLDQSMNTLASLYRNTLGDENLIARLLEKTWGEAAAGGAGGEDIRACLDILLKCSEDLKKCTDIIKQCIRRKGGGGPQDGGASPDSVYRALMTRLSMYLKRLPLELEGLGNGGQGGQGTPGSGHGDLMELVNSLHSLQQTPFSPIFGSEQPPRYEDVVQSPPNPKMTPNSASSTPHLSVQSAPSKALTNGLQHLQPPSSVTHHNLSPSPVTSSPSNRSPTNSPSRLRVSPTPPYSHTPPGSPMEALYIEEEDVDTGKMSEQITQNTSQNKDVSSKSVHISQPDSTGIVYNSTRPSPNALAHRNDDIDKLLMDLENLSQSMSNHRNTEPPLPVKTRKRGVSGLGIVSNEAQTQPKMSQFQVTTPASHLAMNGTGFKAPQGEKRNAGAGEEQEDGALLLRILESIESFAQELVDSGAGSAGSSERNSGKEREVMKLLQGTLASTGRPDTPVVSLTGQNAPAACPTETVPAVTVPAIPPKLSARTPSVTAALPRKTAAEEVCTVTSALLPPPEAASASSATPEAKDGLSEAPPIHPKTTSATVSLHSLAHPAQLGNDASPKVPPARSSPSVVVGRDLAVTIRDIPVLRDTGSTLLIQQTPEVIRVQSKAEKKPGTPPPAPAQASAVSHAPSRRSPSPPPAAPVIIIPSPPPPPAIHIPRFYYPCGLPAAGQPANHDAAIAAIEAAFAEFEEEKADIYEMSKVAKVCECPLYWKAAMFYGAGGERTGFVSVHSFVATWRKLLRGCHDDASRFIHLLAKPGCQYLEQEDFIPLLQDIVDTHPGLTFLKDAPEFHSRYITTVIQRIFYVVNRSWTGRVSMTELRRSNFLQTLALLEEEDDINQITDYFSYEHFYVIYCKFWELDSDHDLYIDHKDLARYNDHASSNRIIERLFSGAVTRGNAVQREGRMSYAEFVWFLISEEDKKNPTSIEYWFRCMDVDGDGVLSMFELEYFYEEQCERMERMGIEPLPFQDLLCQMLDLVKPESPGKMTLGDLKRCRMAHIFFDTFFNLEKYLDHEQRDPFAVHKDLDSDGPEPSDWDKYASEEYEILVAEETANEQIHEGSFEEDYDVDDLQVPAEIGNKIEKLVISDLTA